MHIAPKVIERLSGLDCPLVATLSTSSTSGGGKQITTDPDFVNSLLLVHGDLRERLLDWCLQNSGQVNSSARTWLAITGTCPGEEGAFEEATMVQERQLQVWGAIVDLLYCPEEEGQVEKYPGLVNKLAEAVAFGVQARGDNLDVMPLHLAREVKSGMKGEEVPSLRAVRSFLEEGEAKRREIGENHEQGDIGTGDPNSEGLEEAFTRMSKEMENFNIKYQGELLPWLPVTQSQPKDKPEVIKAMQVTEKTEAFMEDARRLASTAARLEHSKEEVGRQVDGESSLPLLTPVPTTHPSLDSQQIVHNLTSACL